MNGAIAAACFLLGLLTGIGVTRWLRRRRPAGLTHWAPPQSGSGA